MQKLAPQIVSTLPAYETSMLLNMVQCGGAIQKFVLRSANMVECQIPWAANFVLSHSSTKHIFLRKRTPSMEDVMNCAEWFSHEIRWKLFLRRLFRPNLSFKAPRAIYKKCSTVGAVLKVWCSLLKSVKLKATHKSEKLHHATSHACHPTPWIVTWTIGYLKSSERVPLKNAKDANWYHTNQKHKGLLQ